MVEAGCVDEHEHHPFWDGSGSFEGIGGSGEYTVFRGVDHAGVHYVNMRALAVSEEKWAEDLKRNIEEELPGAIRQFLNEEEG